MTATGNAAFERAMAALQAGKVRDAAQQLKTVVRAQPRHIAALNLLGIALTRLGDFNEAESVLRRALDLQTKSDATLHNYAVVLRALGRPDEALRRYGEALALNPAAATTWKDRGGLLLDMKRFNEAIADFARAIELNPRDGETHSNMGMALCALQRYEDGLSAFEKALMLFPDYAAAHSNRGAALLELRRYAQALDSCDRAISLAPNIAAAHSNRGGALCYLKRYAEALQSCDRALALDPRSGGAWLVRGNILCELKRYAEASAAYDKALALRPELAEAWLGRGKVFSDLKRYQEAMAAYDRALVLNPDISFAAGGRLSSKLFMCDWTNLEAETAQFLAGVRSEKQSNDPFVAIALLPFPADQLQCARRYVADLPQFAPLYRNEVYDHQRIRVAYLSADFHEHPIGRLMAGLFERHDRSQFEVTGISIGPDQKSPLRRRIEHAFEHFIDATQSSDQEIAEVIRQREIDIVVDLMGFTQGNRLNVFARRPAPIQVNYLGFVGTMGAGFIDYVIADKIVLPFDQQQYFAEKIVHLPDCFLATDDRMETASAVVSREQAGLPTTGFVFCSFNNSYKLARPIFECWMRLLRAVEGSVLWLAEANPDMAANLRREVERCGIDQSRVIFDRSRSMYAPEIWLSKHLERQPLAGLFLDTVPYNAGATAAVALWSGVPLVTVTGETFVGRMAASMLHAIGLTELATRDLDAYEALALKLAQDPVLLGSIRRKLHDNVRRMPLFDTNRFRRHVERAFTTMVDMHRRGEGPRSFSVESL